MPKVSVIMPSLNVAKYIRPCMESVIKQSLQDIEILAVDAGSTDGTLEILREYEAGDSRIKVLLSGKKSYGYQMNLGLDATQGEYIGIVETDDDIQSNMFEQLFKCADENCLDYVKGYAHAFFDMKNGSRYEYVTGRFATSTGYHHGVFCPAEIPNLWVQDYYIWLGLYRRKFLNGIRFNETSGASFQDIGFVLKTTARAQRAMYIDSYIYNYRQNNAGSSIYNQNGFQYLIDEYTLDESDFQGKGSAWENFFYSRMILQLLWRFRLMALSGNFWSGADQNISILQNKLKSVWKSKKLDVVSLGMTNMALFLLFLCSPSAVFDYYREMDRNAIEANKKLVVWAKNREIVIWSCGNWGKFAHAFLDRNGIDVRAYVDKNPELWNKMVQGVPVISPQKARANFKNSSYLIANKAHGDEIHRELLSWGVKEESIFAREFSVEPLLLI